MSKAFTKEDDGSGEVRLDDLPQSPHPNFVTPSGLADLEERLRTRRSELSRLREGPEDVSNRFAVAIAERDIRFLELRVGRAILVDASGQSPEKVAFGAEVDVLDEDDVSHTFRIVGEDEADAGRGLITRFSPLGAALIGAKLGATVEWKKPRSCVELEIVAIRYPPAPQGV